MKIECRFNNSFFYFEAPNKKILKNYKSKESFHFTDLISNKKTTFFKKSFKKIKLKQLK